MKVSSFLTLYMTYLLRNGCGSYHLYQAVWLWVPTSNSFIHKSSGSANAKLFFRLVCMQSCHMPLCSTQSYHSWKKQNKEKTLPLLHTTFPKPTQAKTTPRSWKSETHRFLLQLAKSKSSSCRNSANFVSRFWGLRSTCFPKLCYCTSVVFVYRFEEGWRTLLYVHGWVRVRLDCREGVSGKASSR